jgi:UDPglucose 6-dehydrogenase
MKIGIIGYGYVGSAVAASYPNDEILINDPQHPSSTVEELKEQCRAIFVCVPTPQSDTGECDTSILESVLDKLSDYTGVIIAKSTASPAIYQELQQRHNYKLAHVPEFLTQARAKFDYVNPHKIVVGCYHEIRHEVADVLMNSAINFDRVDIEYCSIQEASFFKYLANTQLAIKVVVNNEYADLAQQLGVKWERVVDIARTDYRLGATHWAVPGPDGARGFGGACFPKDTAALNHIANTNGVELTMLSTAIAKNKLYRNNNGN